MNFTEMTVACARHIGLPVDENICDENEIVSFSDDQILMTLDALFDNKTNEECAQFSISLVKKNTRKT